MSEKSVKSEVSRKSRAQRCGACASSRLHIAGAIRYVGYLCFLVLVRRSVQRVRVTRSLQDTVHAHLKTVLEQRHVVVSTRSTHAFRSHGRSESSRIARALSTGSAPQERQVSVSCKSVFQTCQVRVSYKIVTPGSHKSVRSECPTRLSSQSVPQERQVRVSQRPRQVRISCKSVKSKRQRCQVRMSWKSVLPKCPCLLAAIDST